MSKADALLSLQHRTCCVGGKPLGMLILQRLSMLTVTEGIRGLDWLIHVQKPLSSCTMP
jgi:hypothetical protein